MYYRCIYNIYIIYIYRHQNHLLIGSGYQISFFKNSAAAGRFPTREFSRRKGAGTGSGT